MAVESAAPSAQTATKIDASIQQTNAEPAAAPADANDNAKVSDKPQDVTQQDQERAVGITAYVSPDAPGFTCVVKQRYTDFLVNEIRPTGEVLHLTEIARPEERQDGQTRGANGRGKRSQAISGAEKKEDAGIKSESNGDAGRKRQADEAEDDVPEDGANKRLKVDERAPENAADAGADTKVEEEPEEDTLVPTIPEGDRNTLVSIFGEPVTQKTLKLYGNVLKYPNQKPRDHETIKSDVIAEKSKRTEAHVAVRRIFDSKLETATLQDTPGAISIRAAPPNSKGNPGRRTDASGGQNGGKKGRVAWDELGGEYLHFTLYKENKDTMEVLYFLASRLKVKISNFQFAGTKDRRGVTVQKVSAYRVRKEQLIGLTTMARGWKLGGFEYRKKGLELGQLNGNEFLLTLRDCHLLNEAESTPEERLTALRGAVEKAADDFSKGGFISYYGLQRFGSYGTGTHATGMRMIQGNLEAAVDGILSYREELLPENQDPSGEGKVPQEDIDRADGLRIWRETQNNRKALDKIPRRFQAETSIITYLGRKGKNHELIQVRDWQGALMSIQRNLRLMYVHAYQSLIWNTVAGKRREFYGDKPVEGDLVIVGEKEGPVEEKPNAEIDQDGEPVINPAGDDAAATEDHFTRARPLSKEEAESGRFNIFDIVLPLPGFDVVYPKNELGKYYEELMASEAGGGLDPHHMRRSWKDVSLSGSYRKMMSRPEGLEVSVKPYAEDLEQMVETDAEKVMKRDMGVPTGLDLASGSTEGDKVAIVLKMQLGSSQYATMALRELTKGGAGTYRTEFAAAR